MEIAITSDTYRFSAGWAGCRFPDSSDVRQHRSAFDDEAVASHGRIAMDFKPELRALPQPRLVRGSDSVTGSAAVAGRKLAGSFREPRFESDRLELAHRCADGCVSDLAYNLPHASYGNGLFLGFPFALGFTSVTIYNWRETRGLGDSIGVACLSVFCVGSLLLVLGLEGLICLFMALMMALPFAFLGGALAYLVVDIRDTRNAIAGALLLLPILAPQEMKLHRGPEHFQVRSSIEIAARPERVWEHVIAFSEINEKPDSPILRSGIAYPIHATISGRGVGAVRECIFTTGAFEEPIDVWDAPNRLHFTVAKQPPVVHEMSWVPDLQPQHITQEYLRSRQGQFVLTQLPDGRTLLEGTTWYDLQYWPSSYWHLWSDAIIHRIHLRVLEHIKAEVERASQ